MISDYHNWHALPQPYCIQHHIKVMSLLSVCFQHDQQSEKQGIQSCCKAESIHSAAYSTITGISKSWSFATFGLGPRFETLLISNDRAGRDWMKSYQWLSTTTKVLKWDDSFFDHCFLLYTLVNKSLLFRVFFYMYRMRKGIDKYK